MVPDAVNVRDMGCMIGARVKSQAASVCEYSYDKSICIAAVR